MTRSKWRWRACGRGRCSWCRKTASSTSSNSSQPSSSAPSRGSRQSSLSSHVLTCSGTSYASPTTGRQRRSSWRRTRRRCPAPRRRSGSGCIRRWRHTASRCTSSAGRARGTKRLSRWRGSACLDGHGRTQFASCTTKWSRGNTPRSSDSGDTTSSTTWAASTSPSSTSVSSHSTRTTSSQSTTRSTWAPPPSSSPSSPLTPQAPRAHRHRKCMRGRCRS
mmetsp:Transcript_62086/g.147103  ORF Transcript_62086/g.147103 Transcript_62086/m.147103 type:complete len:220 (-) Transcript_62086:30-689(-)